ncbi:MAG: hypothetical protein AAB875_05415, partial [Patescibacteria group bacterium]
EGLIKKVLEITQKVYAKAVDIEEAVEKVLKNNPKPREDYKKGKSEVLGYLMGQVQKELKGSGDPRLIRELLIKILEK